MSEIKRDHQLTKPVYLKQLVDRKGPTVAAQILGMSPTTLNKNLRESTTKRSTELASKLLMQESGEKAKTPDILIARVPQDKMELVTAFLKTVGVEFRRFTE